MAPTLQILSAFYTAVLLTFLFATMAELPKRQRTQGTQWKAPKRWTIHLALGSLVLAFIVLVFLCVDTGSRDRWRLVFLSVLDLAALAMLLDRLLLVLRNRKASLSRRLARSSALVLAAAVAFAGFYLQHLTS
jgi:peptidoglycan/LPS O-acetylase OafA/YrhL